MKCSGLAGEWAPVRTRIGGPWGSLGGPRVYRKRRWFSGGVLGWSWEVLGKVLEVWGDPWVSPGRLECWYFFGFRWFSEMSCFLMFFHRYLKATLFSLKTKNHAVILLIMEGQHVDISLVLKA